ncbi:1209_t:CDS:2 [Scutellospora calospora]|uniref:1209_t:CDS:1 n=1 Tax=Scutellospora calospora TaxID=85575 RepID=A0ACA9KHK4_9GLOM|nr:1209_t:CDS:2 [Scutellospora calospora]
MIYDLASEAPLNNDLFLNEDTVFELDKEMQPINFNNDEIISNITKQSISIKNSLDMTATLLDPRYKSLDFLSDDSEKQLTIQKLYDEFSKIENSVSKLSINLTLSNTESSIYLYKAYLQQRQIKRKKKDNLYLVIPAMSVSSERLFSDASNLIGPKRINLDSSLVSQILFLKRNLGKIDVFELEWNENNIDHSKKD